MNQFIAPMLVPRGMARKEAERRYAHSAGYTGVVEKTYTSENQQIKWWTNYFAEEVSKKEIFDLFETSKPSQSRSIAVGTQWYRLSEYVPSWLCLAAAKVSTNEIRHYVIQTAFEELGMRKVDDVHCEMFRQSTHLVGLSDKNFDDHQSYDPISKELNYLHQIMQEADSDAEILGMLLGLEAPAEENIEAVFSGLVHSKKISLELQKTEFFRIHRAVEEEHVRLTISNFLRFCTSDESKKEFLKGFQNCLGFWKRFWDQTTQLAVKIETNGN